jgi:histidinol phosphatase-like enzyme
LSGCKRLKEADFLLVVVSNQPDVARGTQSRATVETINKRLADAISVLDHFVSTPVKNTATVAIAENQNRECYFMLPDS